MTTEINEFDDGYNAAFDKDAAPATAEMPLASMEITTDDSTPDATIAMGSPVSNMTEPSSVYVSANSITPVSYTPDSTIVAFDVVFSVSCTEGDKTSTYQVVKRIGVDKMRMMNDAKVTTPISIVEAKAPPAKPEREQPLIDISKERFKALAGLK